MKCFYHHDRDAVGTCKSCQRGLCPDCAVDLDRGLACRGRCEEDTRNLIQLIANNVRMAPTSMSLIRLGRRNGIVAGVFTAAMGGWFLVWGIFHDFMFSVALGAGLMIYGVLLLLRFRKVVPPKDERPVAS